MQTSIKEKRQVRHYTDVEQQDDLSRHKLTERPDLTFYEKYTQKFDLGENYWTQRIEDMNKRFTKNPTNSKTPKRYKERKEVEEALDCVNIMKTLDQLKIYTAYLLTQDINCKMGDENNDQRSAIDVESHNESVRASHSLTPLQKTPTMSI